MAHSVEGRFPFLDPRVIAFAAGLSPRLKMKVLNEKYLLKQCARPLVPPEVVTRPKQPYRAPDARSFFSSRSDDYVEQLLSTHNIRRDGIFNPAAVERLVEKARKGGIVGVSDDMAVVGILSTELLIDTFIARQRSAAPTVDANSCALVLARKGQAHEPVRTVQYTRGRRSAVRHLPVPAVESPNSTLCPAPPPVAARGRHASPHSQLPAYKRR
jgi:hypothetical protein